MAKTITPDVGTTTMQTMLDAGLNGFAVELLVESYASPRRVASVGDLKPLDFVFRGVRVRLDLCDTPEKWVEREKDPAVPSLREAVERLMPHIEDVGADGETEFEQAILAVRAALSRPSSSI